MADTNRLSHLPMIKCSTCGVDIEILQLADHICAPAPPEHDVPSQPKLDRAATFNAPSYRSRTPEQTKSARLRPPPRIDPFAANKPFQPQNQYLDSPMSNYSDRSRSPLSPPFRKPSFNRSATTPLAQSLNPPLPELSSNLDCAFPPFPTKRSATPSIAKPSSNGGLSPSYGHPYAEADPMYAPLSPRANGGERVAKRMDSIAPGPFDGRGDSRPSTSDGRRPSVQGFGHRRTATQGSSKSIGVGHDSRTSVASSGSRGSTFSSRSGLPSRPKLGMAATEPVPPPPLPRQSEESEGIDAFLSRLKNETLQPTRYGQEARSKTFPLRHGSRDESMAESGPEEPAPPVRRPTDIDRYSQDKRSDELFLDMGNDSVAIKPSLRPLNAAQAQDAMQNSLHTPSDSGYSDDSISSGGFRSAASSRSSPPASEASGQHSRNVSKIARSDFGNDDIQRVSSPESFTDPRTPPQPQKRRDPAPYAAYNAPETLMPPPSRPFFEAPESPMDPAIHKGLSYQPKPRETPRERADPAVIMGRSPPKRLLGREDMDPARRPTTARKSKCRGCNEIIVGKSVKDSSGRLTGRYHKHCFVCRTCGDGFPSTEFYVFENSPYCEHHYHELNGSLCGSCDRGIEGQYLETDQRQKFHPRCFTCSTCRVVLRDDYFEVNGRPYCERHAYAAQKTNNSLAPGNGRLGPQSNLQKRRTRIMMMH